MKQCLIGLLGVLALVIIIVMIESRKVSEQTRPVWEFWSEATENARKDNLTTQEFYKKYSNRGTMVSDETWRSPALVERIKLRGLLCSEFSIRIYYSSDGDDSANLVMITGSRHGKLCII